MAVENENEKNKENKKGLEEYKLPDIVPISWIEEPTDKSAEQIAYGYRKVINSKMAIQKLLENQPSIKFSLSNISEKTPHLAEILFLRLDGPLQKARIFYFNVTMVSLI